VPSSLSCTAVNPSDRTPLSYTSNFAISNLNVNCVNPTPASTPTYTVGGTVSGVPAMTNIMLTMASNDVVTNGQSSGSLTDGAYQFTTAVTSGSNFSIATTSPDGYSCTVAAPYAAGTTISSTVTNANVTCVSTGGGGFAPGTVNGQVTNNGPDTRTILVENGANQVAVVVNSNSTANFTIPGQLAQGVSYSVTASDGTMPTPGSGLLNCGVNNGTGNMVASPGAVSNVSVTCQLTLP
jgi:hypothetical protein